MQGFGKRLRHLRRAHLLTQAELADACGVKKQTICKYEKGQIMPAIEPLLAMSGVLETSTDWLLKGDREHGA